MNGMLHGGRRQHYLGAALLSLASMLGSCTAAAISCVSPGDAPTQVRGTVLAVLEKLPDGSWKCFRAMGIAE